MELHSLSSIYRDDLFKTNYLHMKNKHIVVVDDEPDILELIKYYLTKEGVKADVFTSPIEALSHINATLPDLIISDWMMPELSGIELCRKIRTDEKYAHIPVIMLTCKGGDQDRKAAYMAGASKFLAKPISMKLFIEEVRGLITGEYSKI
jgi:DNA-binding response OmpR family regulator